MNSPNDIVHPFANGTEFMLWDEHNCCQCAKGYRDLEGRPENPDRPLQFDPALGRVPFLCDIQAAVVANAAGDPIPAAIAARWGITPNDIWSPPCRERE